VSELIAVAYKDSSPRRKFPRTVMSYVANSINPDGVRAQEIRESLETDTFLREFESGS
jgi:hypothetical protein